MNYSFHRILSTNPEDSLSDSRLIRGPSPEEWTCHTQRVQDQESGVSKPRPELVGRKLSLQKLRAFFVQLFQLDDSFFQGVP